MLVVLTFWAHPSVVPCVDEAVSRCDLVYYGPSILPTTVDRRGGGAMTSNILVLLPCCPVVDKKTAAVIGMQSITGLKESEQTGECNLAALLKP